MVEGSTYPDIKRLMPSAETLCKYWQRADVVEWSCGEKCLNNSSHKQQRDDDD
ncbi:hypothetical protein JRQ81_006041, partial [Phrynocephalus forsythii]